TPGKGQDKTFVSSAPLADASAAVLTSDGQIVVAGASFGKQASLVKLQRSDSPTGLFGGSPIKKPRSTSYRFNVTWQDDAKVDRHSLGSGDVAIDFPDGSVHSAKLLSADKSDDAQVISTVFRIAAPGGSWDNADNGTYQVRIR